MLISHRLRASVVSAVAGGAVWLAAAGTGGASDFGTRKVDAERYGSVVSISTPSLRLFQEPDEFIVHRAVVQSTADSPGLIQAGVYRSGPRIELDNCGTHSGYVVFTEVLAAGSMGYRCQLFNAVAPGTTVTVDVFRFHPAGSWGVRLDGALTGLLYRLGFDRGEPAIGSEIQDIDENYGTHAATRFGPAGRQQWSVYTTVGRSRPHQVNGADGTSAYAPKDAFWKVPRPPARMTIRHRQ